MDACTIIAKNYVAFARVLAESYLAQHPDARFHVLVIDDVEDRFDPREEVFEAIGIEQLGIEDFPRMAGLYDVLELSTAVKPWLLRHLLREARDGVLYLDPDMRLYRPLTELFDAVRAHDLVLCPHNLEPMPRDGRRPSEQDILIAGVYNLGFLGVRPGATADRLLDWWAERLATDCIVDPERGFFVDQRWMDFAPAILERYHVLRDPGFNVAYWNLSSRPVSRRDDAWWVSGEVPLRLFHFSGFDAHRPQLLSKYQDRIELASEPDLARLCADYAAELIGHGAAEAREWPYSWARTASGITLNRPLRRLYRELALEGFTGSLFEPDGESAFLALAREPAVDGGEHGINRYLAALYHDRADLRSTYPNPADAASAAGYLGWARQHGRSEVPIDPALLDPDDAPAAPAKRAAPPKRIRPPSPLGVTVAGYLRSELGVGEVARQAIAALDTAGIPTLPVGLPTPHSREGHAFAHVAPAGEGYPINLVCVNADMLPAFAHEAGAGFFEGRHTIGWWWWEVDAFPERWIGAFDHVDELWAGSRFVAEALAAVSPVPVLRMPTPVSVTPVAPADRAALGLPDGFVFLYIFDFHSVGRRKNPLGLIDAFLRAFPQPEADVSLVLKSINGDHHPADVQALRAAAAGQPHVLLVDRYVTPADRTRFLMSCDAYVSLHRSEGFGMTMAEAMLLEKPVIATGYSGNLDFMTEQNAFLVEHAIRPIGADAPPYPPEGRWAEPDLDDAAAQMRRVVEDPGEAARRARRGRDDVARTNATAVAGAEMARRIRTVHPRAAGLRDPAQGAEERATAASRMLGQGSEPVSGRRFGMLRRASRRAALRAMRPHTFHQARIDRELADGLREASLELERLAAESQRRLGLESALLRELRDVDARLTALEQLGNGITEPKVAELGARLDQLRERVVAQDDALAGVGPQAPDTGANDSYPEAPAEPWSHEYNRAHARFVASALDDPELLAAFRAGGGLPGSFGRGYDERVVEFPWALSHPLAGRLIDAGSTLNHLHILERVRPRLDQLLIVTLSPEDRSYPGLGVSYLFADLRRLPLQDGVYDQALSISTFEHIGMSNEHYGSDVPAAADPQQEALAAARELCRVVRPGGHLYLTVPVGRGERFPWVRTFTLDELDELVDACGGEDAEETFFRHADGGWRRVTRAEVTDARYRDHFSSGPVGADRVVAAEAVGCLRLRRGAA